MILFMKVLNNPGHFNLTVGAFEMECKQVSLVDPVE